jgi:hypothetical protein
LWFYRNQAAGIVHSGYWLDDWGIWVYFFVGVDFFLCCILTNIGANLPFCQQYEEGPPFPFWGKSGREVNDLPPGAEVNSGAVLPLHYSLHNMVLNEA